VIRTNGHVLQLITHDMNERRRKKSDGNGDDDDGLLDTDEDEDFELDDAFLEELDDDEQLETSDELKSSSNRKRKLGSAISRTIEKGDTGAPIRSGSSSSSSSRTSRSVPNVGSGSAAPGTIEKGDTGAPVGSGSSSSSSSSFRTSRSVPPVRSGAPVSTLTSNINPDVEEDDDDLITRINFKRSSIMLPNLEKVYDSREKCPNPRDVVVVGIDPGERVTMCCTRVSFTSGERESVSIRRSFLYRPYTRFKQLYERRLMQAGLTRVVSAIPPLKLGGVVTYLQYLDATGASPTVRSRLMAFYQSTWYLKKAWDLSKAQTACFDYGIKAILRLVGGSEGRSYQGAGPPPIFAIGLGDFNTKTGLPSKHSKMEKIFIRKVRNTQEAGVEIDRFF
jgi:hypothetical protein